jgi:hypothetical protein
MGAPYIYDISRLRVNVKIMHTASIMKKTKEIKLISAWQHLQFNKKSKIKKLTTH